MAGIAGARRRSKPSTPRCVRDPIYGQVPAFAGGERGVLDLLAVDRSGRLAVVELKASADLQPPLQALDYWIRVKWHLDRGEFTVERLFSRHRAAARASAPAAGVAVARIPPHHRRRYCATSLPPLTVERIGLAVEWRKGLKVMFRLTGAEPPR